MRPDVIGHACAIIAFREAEELERRYGRLRGATLDDYYSLPGDAAFPPFYPSSGAVDSMAHNVLNVALTPMWRGGGGGRPSVATLCQLMHCT